ncbi:MFS general substrate transporter [Cucurbitaria berberidis CBS 394.84]|uniref:MFS general substrate transporter n=1 Tax=Cucurbitaria berberidis CBS 394.84 TaxID=1168544 RepID=A0A9P4L6L1_9PLEO|nr:MFS general substrate transporter [Cucurbitaria berberidis CBS 394.84]KAF1843935.1 MFS general substrate transporter [Cucurbitaria berberidis CBS 394.84]
MSHDISKPSFPDEKIETINDTHGSNIDPIAEKKLLRKCDARVLPPLFVLFLLAFLDRTNIGLVEDLDMTGSKAHRYNVALFIFFVPYILFEVPSNLVLKKLAPSTWLSLIMVLWGISTIGMGLVNNYEGLLAMRVLLGLFEAGLFPGCVYLISMYYKRYELQWRLTLFFTASIIAGAFGGLLAFAIAKMDGIAGYGGWRWIFIIEGIVTVAFGLITKFWVTDWPETAKFLNEDERALLLARLSSDTGDAVMHRLDKRAARRIFSDPKIYLGTAAYFGYAGSFFVPTIVKELGFTSSAAQVRSIPIFIVATATAIITAYLTDRLRHRYWFCIFGLVVASIGYIMLLAQHNLSPGVKYFALFLIVPGGYITQPVFLVWMSNLVSGHYKRSVSSAMQVGFGNLGGIVASNVFFGSEAPRYPTGYGVSLGMLWICGAACTGMYFLVNFENRKRERGERDSRLQEPDADNLGDDHPHFRLTT